MSSNSLTNEANNMIAFHFKLEIHQLLTQPDENFTRILLFTSTDLQLEPFYSLRPRLSDKVSGCRSVSGGSGWVNFLCNFLRNAFFFPL